MTRLASASGLAYKIFGPLGAQWFYEGESLGYRTLYVWIADQDLMITVQTNSQPPEGTDKLGRGRQHPVRNREETEGQLDCEPTIGC